MSESIYVYDAQTGKIKYTVDEIHESQVESFQVADGESFYVGPSGQKISGTFVKKDMETGQHFGISPIENMVFINLNKHIVVANGTDEAVISGLRKGMHVDINHEHSYIVDDESGSTLELSCNNYSYVAQHNEMKVYLKAYGCHDSVISIKFVEEI